MKGGPHDGVGARSRAQLEEGAASKDARRTLNEREIRVAGRLAVVDRKQYERELEARLNAWQHSMARREESETQLEGEAERHAAATEEDRIRDAQLYSSDDEDAGSPTRKRSEALHAFEEEEEVRRSRQREEAFDAAVDWAASTMMCTPVSAPARAPFVQQQLSPIESEQEFTYDSDAEREGGERASATPPYDADTELAEYTAMSA